MLSAMVERLGPVIGGVLGCVPHVAVVGSIGFLLQTASSDEFRIAMLSMPLGMLCNSVLDLGIGISPGLWLASHFHVKKRVGEKFHVFRARLP